MGFITSFAGLIVFKVKPLNAKENGKSLNKI